MLAARYLAPDHLATEEVARPTAGPGEAIVRVDACGFCGSDLGIVGGTHPRARAPLTIGHELAGRVVELGGEQGDDVAVGDRVTMFPLIACGRCRACREGHAHVCRELRLFGFDVDGGMADYVRLPATALIRLPDAMPAAVGALIEPLAVAVHAVERGAQAAPGLAVVLGAGPIGLLTALVARVVRGPDLLISDVAPDRLARAERLGLAAVPAGDALAAAVAERTGDDGAPLILECAGHPSSALQMTQLACSRATLVNVGVFKAPAPVDLQAVNFKELSVIGSRVYTRDDFVAAIALAGELPLEEVITGEFALADAAEAFRSFRAGEGCKVIVRPDGAAR